MFSFRLRGGVFQDNDGWGVVVVIGEGADAQDYRSPYRCATEKEAEDKYKELRGPLFERLRGMTLVNNLDPFAPPEAP